MSSCPLAEHFEVCPDWAKTCDGINCDVRKKFRNVDISKINKVKDTDANRAAAKKARKT